MCTIVLCMRTMYSTGKATVGPGRPMGARAHWQRQTMYSHVALDNFIRRPLKTSPRTAVAYCRVSIIAHKDRLERLLRA